MTLAGRTLFVLLDVQEHPTGVTRLFRDRKGTPKKLCNKDFAEFSAELSGAVCLKTLVLFGRELELFRNFFGVVRAIFLALGFFVGP